MQFDDGSALTPLACQNPRHVNLALTVPGFCRQSNTATTVTT